MLLLGCLVVLHGRSHAFNVFKRPAGQAIRHLIHVKLRAKRERETSNTQAKLVMGEE